MSKLFDALNKVKEERQRLSEPVSPAPVVTPTYHPSSSRSERSGSWRIGYGLAAVSLVVAMTGSVLVNLKTLSQLKNSGAITLTLSKQMEEQKQELAAINRYWMKAEAVRKDQREQIIALQKSVKILNKDLEEAKNNLAKVEDLRLNDKLLLEKFVALNDKVKKLSEISAVNGK